jgi:hypothetical protein
MPYRSSSVAFRECGDFGLTIRDPRFVQADNSLQGVDPVIAANKPCERFHWYLEPAPAVREHHIRSHARRLRRRQTLSANLSRALSPFRGNPIGGTTVSDSEGLDEPVKQCNALLFLVG